MNRVHLTWVWLTPSKARKKQLAHEGRNICLSQVRSLCRENHGPCPGKPSAVQESLEQAEGSLACSARCTIGAIFHTPKCWALSLCSKVFGIPAGRHKLQFWGRIRGLPELRSSERLSGVRSSLLSGNRGPQRWSVWPLAAQLVSGWAEAGSADAIHEDIVLLSLGRAPWGLGFCWFHLCHPH